MQYSFKLNLVFGLIFFFQYSNSQTSPIDVAENTFKVGGLGEEVFYYGFAENDQLIFNFEELDGKELKEVEIIEMPGSSRFMDYKTKRTENKIITIYKTGIYKFRFANSALGGRVCKFRIQRIPNSDNTKNFNTTVYWKTVNDTSYTTTQERYLIKADTSVSHVTEEIAKVHSQGNLNGNKTTFNFTLPENTVAWSYYIGVDQAGQEVYEKATQQLARHAAPMLARIPGYGPLAALALEGASYLSQLQSGEDIDFYIVEGDNVTNFLNGQQFSYIKNGKVINDYSSMKTNFKGNYYVCLYNDNAITGVTVAVKIHAIVVNKQYGIRDVKHIHLTPHEEAYLKN